MLTIARFSKVEDAHLLRMRLEAGGVAAYILDENMIQTDWLYSDALGGVRVQIAEEDVDEAREILEIPPEPLEAERPACPACACVNTVPDELPRRLSFLSLLLLGCPLIFGRRAWVCEDCGRKFREEKARASAGN